MHLAGLLCSQWHRHSGLATALVGSSALGDAVCEEGSGGEAAALLLAPARATAAGAAAGTAAAPRAPPLPAASTARLASPLVLLQGGGAAAARAAALPSVDFPVLTLPVGSSASSSEGAAGAAGAAAPSPPHKWHTGSASSGVRALFEGALHYAPASNSAASARKAAALAHPSVQRALAHILALCMAGPRVKETLADGSRAIVTGQCLISQISPSVKTLSNFPLPLASKEGVAAAVAAVAAAAGAGAGGAGAAAAAASKHEAMLHAASSMRSLSDLIKELGLGVIAVFDKEGLHGSRAVGVTEFGRARI